MMRLIQLVLSVQIAFAGAQVTVVQHPANETFCEGTDAVLSCTIFDNSDDEVADNTVWFNLTTRASIQSNMDRVVTNSRNGDMVTSILNITDISVYLNNTEYICVPSLDIRSFPGALIIIVPPMTAPILMKPTDLTRTSFTITWTIASSNNRYSYIITWTNLLTGDTNMTVLENTDSYEVTGLSGSDNYNVSVTAKNKCGMMESDSITVYDKPDAPLNVRIPPEDIKHDSFIVQWDAVTDVFPITYTVRWYGEDIDNTNTTNELSYTITGLTSNTSYSVTVVANNTCCGAGPVSDVMMLTTMSDNDVIPTSITTSTTTVVIPSTDPIMNGNDEDENDNIALIVGIAVGSILLIIIVTVVVAVLIYRWRRGNSATHSATHSATPPDVAYSEISRDETLMNPSPTKQQGDSQLGNGPPPLVLNGNHDNGKLSNKKKWEKLTSANEVYTHLKQIAEDWKEIATQLLPEKHVTIINTIETNSTYCNAAQKALYEVLCKWKQCTKCEQRNWETLCSVAQRNGDISLEEYMKENHLKGSEEPTAKDLMKWSKVSPLGTSNDGRSFAYDLLSRYKNDVDRIYCNLSGGGCEEALQEVLKKWFQCTTDASWENIVDALNTMNQVHVVEEIVEQHQINDN